jgi:hypothetical protein
MGAVVAQYSVYGLEDRGSIPGGAKDFSFNLCVQTGRKPHTAPYAMGTGVACRGVKRGQGVTLCTSPPLRMSMSFFSSLSKRLHDVLRDSFTYLH